MFKFFRRDKTNKPSEAHTIAMHGAVMGDSQRPVDEQTMAEQLGINIHTIEDDKLNSFLEQIAIIKGPDGTVKDVDLNALALRVMVSKLIRSSWVDPIDVDIAQLEVERLINRVEMEMDEDTYEYGGTNLLEAVAKIIQTAWSDAKGGRKAKLLKVTPRVYEITMAEPGKKKGGILP